jgi:RHS repeat-associated protein
LLLGVKTRRIISKIVGSTTTQFIYDGFNPVQLLNGSSPPGVIANLLTGLKIDEYFVTSAGGGLNFMSDALGSTVGLVNSSGAIVGSLTYQPFGKSTASGSATTAFQFTGRENDSTGLDFYRARYYSPLYQRFIAQDPIGFVGGSTNMYTYALNNPLSLIDPSGGCSQPGRVPFWPCVGIVVSETLPVITAVVSFGNVCWSTGFVPACVLAATSAIAEGEAIEACNSGNFGPIEGEGPDVPWDGYPTGNENPPGLNPILGPIFD